MCPETFYYPGFLSLNETWIILAIIRIVRIFCILILARVPSTRTLGVWSTSYIKDSKYRTFVFPCVLLLYKSINLPLLPAYTGILALFYKHKKSVEFVILCARSPWSHRPERNISSFVYEVSIQNDFQYFLLLFIPFILSSVWFFISFPVLNKKYSPDKRSFWWQKELQERLICTREVFYGLNVFYFSCLVYGSRWVNDVFFYKWGSLVKHKEK